MPPLPLRVWMAIIQFFTVWGVRCYLYKWKSDLHRWIYDREWATVELSTYVSIADLQKWMQGFVWKADGLTELWDAVCTPNKVQAVGRGNSPHGNDCDEEAVYLTAVIEKSLAAGLMQEDGVANPRFLSVTWFAGRACIPNGHNVCLLEYPQKSDGSTWYAYMDYGAPSTKYRTVQEVVDRVRQIYAGQNGALYLPLMYAVQRLDLTPERVVAS